MQVIGLTGGIGAGKTTVANLFAEHGVPIIDADVIARDVTLPNQLGYAKIVSHFGPNILQADGTLDRKKLRDLIFKNPAERQWLEELLHPLIKKRIEKEIGLLTAPYCIVVIPLLIEVKAYEFINRILIVDTDEHLQIQRASARDKSSTEEIAAILASQTSRTQRLAIGDDVIVNNGTLLDLAPQVAKLHEKYLALG
jgi:dephospho-CoA kinase